jgi:hypothetical protein
LGLEFKKVVKLVVINFEMRVEGLGFRAKGSGSWV